MNKPEDAQNQNEGDGNVVGDEGTSQVIKAEGGSTISQVVQIAGDYYAHPPYPAAESPTGAPSYLPPRAYHRLVGRFNELDQVMSALRDPKRKPMIAVVGLGGIGKTALAREAAERCEQEKLFNHIVWTSSKA
jgi:hypothetical protein